MIQAFPAPSVLLAGYTAAAGVMIAFNIWVFLQFFPRDGGTPSLSRATLVAYVLVSSMFLWISVLYDELGGGGQLGATAILFGVQVMMIAPFAWAFTAILRGSEHFVSRSSWAWPLLLAFVMPANEFLMGSVWVALLGGPSALSSGGPWAFAQVISNSVGTVWFFWSMFVNMLLLLFWVPIPSLERDALLLLSASSLIGPWIVSDLLAGVVLMGALMTVTFGWLLFHLHRTPTRSAETLRVVLWVAAGLVVMAAGQATLVLAPSAPWSALPFTASMLVVMTGEMLFVARRILRALPFSGAELDQLVAVPGPVAATD